MNDINKNINNIYESDKLIINFIPEEKEIDIFNENIKNFGKITVISNISKLSLIIKDDINSNNLIDKWIKESINKKEIKYELIIKLSENGSKSEDFHKYCDNKGPTLILIKTTKIKYLGDLHH